MAVADVIWEGRELTILSATLFLENENSDTFYEKIKRLSVKNNLICEIKDFTFLKNLEYINLSQNMLTTFPASVKIFCCLTNIS